MSTRITQHGEVSPGVPLIHKGGRHLVRHVLIDFPHHRIASSLVGLLQEFREKFWVYFNLTVILIVSGNLVGKVLGGPLDSI